MLVGAFLAASVPASTAWAQWTPPNGALGWCTATGPGTEECFGDETSACQRQLDAGGYPPLFGYRSTQYWNVKVCDWAYRGNYHSPTNIVFKCASGFVRQAPGLCVLSNEDFAATACFCGTANPETPGPIDILTGAKRFSARDFALADAGLPIDRYFSTRPTGAVLDTLLSGGSVRAVRVQTGFHSFH